jgi:hypothetical protein
MEVDARRRPPAAAVLAVAAGGRPGEDDLVAGRLDTALVDRLLVRA